jgi:hypothetical protein
MLRCNRQYAGYSQRFERLAINSLASELCEMNCQSPKVGPNHANLKKLYLVPPRSFRSSPSLSTSEFGCPGPPRHACCPFGNTTLAGQGL